MSSSVRSSDAIASRSAATRPSLVVRRNRRPGDGKVRLTLGTARGESTVGAAASDSLCDAVRPRRGPNRTTTTTITIDEEDLGDGVMRYRVRVLDEVIWSGLGGSRVYPLLHKLGEMCRLRDGVIAGIPAEPSESGTPSR